MLKIKQIIQQLEQLLQQSKLTIDDKLAINNALRQLISANRVVRPPRPTAVQCKHPGCKALVNRRKTIQMCPRHYPWVCKTCKKPFRREGLLRRDFLDCHERSTRNNYKRWKVGICPSCMAKKEGLTLLQFIDRNREAHQQYVAEARAEDLKAREQDVQLRRCTRNRKAMRKAYSIFVQVLREQLPALFRWCVGEQIDLTVEDEPDFPWEKRAQVQFVWAWNTLSAAWELGHRGYLEYVMIFVRQGLTYRAQAQIDADAPNLSVEAQEIGRIKALEIRTEILGRKNNELFMDERGVEGATSPTETAAYLRATTDLQKDENSGAKGGGNPAD